VNVAVWSIQSSDVASPTLGGTVVVGGATVVEVVVVEVDVAGSVVVEATVVEVVVVEVDVAGSVVVEATVVEVVVVLTGSSATRASSFSAHPTVTAAIATTKHPRVNLH